MEPLGVSLRRSRDQAREMERRRIVDGPSAVTPVSAATASPKTITTTTKERTQRPFGQSHGKAVPDTVLLIHRHHHHHYHHHYLLEEETHHPHISVHEPSHAPADASIVGRVDPRAVCKASDNVEHLHYHQHTREEGIPPHARTLFEKAMEIRTDAQHRGRGGGSPSTPDTRLPRL